MLSRFKSLDTLLLAHQNFWRFEPFHESRQATHRFSASRLGEWLDSVSNHEVALLKQDSKAVIQLVSQFLPELRLLPDLCALASSPQTSATTDPHLTSGIPGRKLAQIEAMSLSAIAQHQGDEWLEWCAGKGFLGRILASQSGDFVTSFEWQQSLCEHGQHSAKLQKLPVKFIQGDAFCCEHHKVFNARQHAVALHACGDLHVVLMQYATQHQLPAMTIAPCCYHLIRDDHYQPLSTMGRLSSLHLNRAELRIPLQETVTGGERVVRHRRLEMSFRLGFDELLRAELGLKDYLPIPSIKKSQLQLGFAEFCRWAAVKKGIALNNVDFEAYQILGEERFFRMEKLSLVQQAFHRALELWLVLDKSLYLQEQGYQVTLSEFCDKKITPRNILIHAALVSDD